MEWRHVTENVVIANYGGSKQVDNDDGSLFWRVYSNFMAFGWCQKFKCGGIESFDNVKAMVELGGKFNAGCVTQAPGTPQPGSHDSVFAPNVWRNDVLIPLSLSEDFQYRQSWGTQGTKGAPGYYDWDKSQVSNITIYMGKPGINAVIQDSGNSKTLQQWTAMGNDPHSTQHNAWPPINSIIQMAENALGTWSDKVHREVMV